MLETAAIFYLILMLFFHKEKFHPYHYNLRGHLSQTICAEIKKKSGNILVVICSLWCDRTMWTWIQNILQVYFISKQISVWLWEHKHIKASVNSATATLHIQPVTHWSLRSRSSMVCRYYQWRPGARLFSVSTDRIRQQCFLEGWSYSPVVRAWLALVTLNVSVALCCLLALCFRTCSRMASLSMAGD